MTRNILYWSLYDFANSVLFIVFIFYFPQWLVVDQGNPAWWFNGTLIISSLLFIATAPFVSTRVDIHRKKIGGLRVWSIATLVSFLGTAGIAVFAPDCGLAATLLYTAGMYAYLMCFLYFTPMLNDLSTRGNRGRISGIGHGCNAAGQVAGLLLTLPFVSGAVSLFGASARAETLFPSIIGMCVLVLPMLFFYRDPVSSHSVAPASAARVTAVNFLRPLWANKPFFFLLLAYFFFGDALLTFSSNFSLYLEELYATPDTTKALLTVGILALSAVGASASGFIADKYGHKKMLVVLLVFWVLLFTIASLIHNFSLMLPIFLFAGLCFGPVWSISRAMVGQLSSVNETVASYSYYNIAERFATFIGPLTWSGVLLVMGESTTGYQWAMFSMGFLVILGMFVLGKVPETAVRAGAI